MSKPFLIGLRRTSMILCDATPGYKEPQWQDANTKWPRYQFRTPEEARAFIEATKRSPSSLGDAYICVSVPPEPERFVEIKES